jgi:EAL domain-containing protein (putative c-di-GMP-specific phosphodiesterase class I)
VQGLVNLGHSLNLTVVGEGVETADQASALRAIGCESVQGFFFGYPGPAERLWDARRERLREDQTV